MAATAVYSSRTTTRSIQHDPSQTTQLPRRLPSEDILAETLVQQQGDVERDYTDDLEDLVKLQVTPQQLHSRRSHATIDTSPVYPPEPPLSPTSHNQRSLIPRLHPTSSRSPSPEVALMRKGDKERSGSISSSNSLSRIPTSTGMLRGNSGTSNYSNLSGQGGDNDQEMAERQEEEERWETLQVGAGNRKNDQNNSGHQAFPKSTTTPTRNQNRQPRSSDSRKRAQTNNNTIKPSPSTPQTSSSSRKPYSNRTNYTPSPSSTKRTKKPSTSTPPVRRKSMSSTPREFSSYDLSSLPPEAFSPSPLPPPIPIPPSPFLSDSLQISPTANPNSLRPLIYKDSNGQLTDQGREEDRIIPTVAKRLEAERLRKLMERGEGVGLVDEWGVDGAPMSQRAIEARRREIAAAEKEGKLGETETGRAIEEEKASSSVTNDRMETIQSTMPHEQSHQLRTESEKTPSTSPPKSAAPANRANAQLRTEGIKAQVRDDASKAGCCSCIIC